MIQKDEETGVKNLQHILSLSNGAEKIQNNKENN